jgi:hypothetical protein
VLRYGCLLLLILVFPGQQARTQDFLYSVSVLGSLNTTSELFHHPDDPDPLLRSEYYPLNTVLGGGLEVRRSFTDLRLALGASVELLTKSETSTLSLTSLPTAQESQGVTVAVPVEDGYTVLPVELTVYVAIPVGNEALHFYIGAGGGAYIGRRRYTFAGLDASVTDHSAGYGIHVLAGSEYFLSPLFSLRSDVKFRDVHFETVNQFDRPVVSVEGHSVLVPKGDQASRVNIDGLSIALHIAYHF